MPISKSAKRALKVSRKKAVFNERLLRLLKRLIKKPLPELAKNQQLIDKVAKHRLISKQRAARLKSRLVKKIKSKSS